MEGWLVALITTACTFILTFFLGKACEWFYKNTEHYKELKKQEETNRIKDAVKEEINPKFDSLNHKMDSNFNYLNDRIDKIDIDVTSIKAGNQASLRNILYRVYNECKHKGFATIEEKENFINLYNKYHDLGANGVMDSTKEKMMSLPTEKTEKKKTRLNS